MNATHELCSPPHPAHAPPTDYNPLLIGSGFLTRDEAPRGLLDRDAPFDGALRPEPAPVHAETDRMDSGDGAEIQGRWGSGEREPLIQGHSGAIIRAPLVGVKWFLRAPRYLSAWDQQCLIPNMKVIEQIRRENLATLWSRSGKTQFDFGEMIGKSQTQVGQWLNASIDVKSGRPRTMSSDIARHIERVLILDEGWMDHDHQEAGSDEARSILTDLMRLSEKERQNVRLQVRTLIELRSEISRLEKQTGKLMVEVDSIPYDAPPPERRHTAERRNTTTPKPNQEQPAAKRKRHST